MNLQKIILLSIISIVLHCNTPSKKNFELQFYSFDKTKIAYTDEGNGETIMQIHGFIMSGSSWNKTELKSQLLDSGYRVIVPY